MGDERASPKYVGDRCPPDVIGHAAWLYCRCALGYRDGAGPRAARGVVVTAETSRRWSRTFGRTDADLLRRRRARPGDKGHRAAVCSTIAGSTHSLWRAVEQDGTALAIPVRPRRDKRAAVRSLRKRRKRLPYVPRAALPGVAHRQHRRRTNRAGHAHQPTRERERRMRRFTSPGHARRFLAADGPISGHFRPCRQRLTARAYRQTRDQRFATWRAVVGLPAAA